MSASYLARPFEVVTINELEARRILNLEEGHYVDLKHPDVRPAKLTESVSAFANTAGGELFVGIGEKIIDDRKQRYWDGFNDTEAANSHIQAIEAMSPLGNHYQAVFLHCPGFKTRDIL